VAKKLD